MQVASKSTASNLQACIGCEIAYCYEDPVAVEPLHFNRGDTTSGMPCFLSEEAMVAALTKISEAALPDRAFPDSFNILRAEVREIPTDRFRILGFPELPSTTVDRDGCIHHKMPEMPKAPTEEHDEHDDFDWSDLLDPAAAKPAAKSAAKAAAKTASNAAAKATAKAKAIPRLATHVMDVFLDDITAVRQQWDDELRIDGTYRAEPLSSEELDEKPSDPTPPPPPSPRRTGEGVKQCPAQFGRRLALHSHHEEGTESICKH